MGPLIETYSAAYKTLQTGQEITCATTGVTYDAVKAPVAALLDVHYLFSYEYDHHLLISFSSFSSGQL